jgi:hypothetical protein
MNTPAARSLGPDCHPVTRGKTGDFRAGFHNLARPLVALDNGKGNESVNAVKGVNVRTADADAFDFQ